MLLIILAVCLAVGLLQAGVVLVSARVERPAWTRPSRQTATVALGAFLVALVIVAVVADAPGRASDAWGEFKSTESGPGEGTGRLGSVAGESRYQFWSSAVDENATAPLIGTGSGTFQYWWAREGDGAETVRDTHSLYMQTLGELGIIGLVLLVAFLGFVFVAGGLRAFRAEAEERTRLAAAIAGFAVFAMTAAVDWMWQVPVLPVAALLLASGLVMAGGATNDKPRLPVLVRVAVAVLAVIAIAIIAIPLASTTLVRRSEADVRGGDLRAALDAARSAQNVQPDAASPRLQEALVLEIEGDFRGAEEAALAATERESTNWRNWLVLSRIAAERGRAKNAVSAYEEARSLNPHAAIFER
jgi:hypothetical protein